MKLYPVIFRGVETYGYFLNGDGHIYSTRQGSLKKIAINCYPDSQNNGDRYPMVSIVVDGIKTTIRLHRLVAETLVGPPKSYPGIDMKVWGEAHPSLKRYLLLSMDVNHIDHNIENFHPSNLEWVTAQGNAAAYQEHKKKKSK